MTVDESTLENKALDACRIGEYRRESARRLIRSARTEGIGWDAIQSICSTSNGWAEFMDRILDAKGCV